MLTVTYFTAPWCGPCKVFGPRLEAFAEKRGFKLIKVNVDEDFESARTWQVQSLPTTIWFDEGGRILTTKIGPLTEDQLEALARGY